jgi:PAS domain S-box-containing protein
MRELFGYGPQDTFDPDPLAHVAPPDRARITDQMSHRLRDERHASYSFSAVRRDGSLFTFGISAQLASYLGKPAIIAIGQDITEKERAESERGDRMRRAEAHLQALAIVTGSTNLSTGNTEDFARELAEAAANATGVERASLWLLNKAETKLRCIDLYEATPAKHSAGATLAQAQFEPEFAAFKKVSYVDAGEPLTDARTAGYAESYLKPLHITSMLDAVVRFAGKTLGVLCLEHVDRPHRWHQDEISFACQLADKFALAIINRDRQQAQDKLRRSLEDSIQAIAATVEMRDPYTAGHERRVAELAAAIGTEMALSPFMVQGIRFGGMIHDLGKIRIPAEILSKPTRLAPAEFNMIKEHAQAGYEILKGIDYPWPVAEMARQHHEHLDGSGYPRGLKGEDILLEARVLAVADTVEAMASHRPYRPGLGIDKALVEIEKGRGKIFDPFVADACLRLFREKEYQLPV